MALKINNNSSITTHVQGTSIEPIVVTGAVGAPSPTVAPAFRETGRRKEMVNHPDHYGGKDNPYEVIKVVRAWNLSFSLGNTIKYIARAGKKDPSKRIEDLHKAMWYLQEEINNEYERSAK